MEVCKYMSKRRKKKKGLSVGGGIIVPLLFFCIVILFWLKWRDIEYEATMRHMADIASSINGRGDFVDYTGEIGVKSIDDIKLYVSNDVKIVYGNIALNWRYDDFVSDELTEPLAKIFISREIDPASHTLRVFWKGVELERMVSRY